jgi:hypothetical protein
LESVISFNHAFSKVAANKELKIDSKIVTKTMANKEIELHNKTFSNKIFSTNKEFQLKLIKMLTNNFKMLTDKILSKEVNHKINNNHKIDKQTIESE